MIFYNPEFQELKTTTFFSGHTFAPQENCIVCGEDVYEALLEHFEDDEIMLQKFGVNIYKNSNIEKNEVVYSGSPEFIQSAKKAYEEREGGE